MAELSGLEHPDLTVSDVLGSANSSDQRNSVLKHSLRVALFGGTAQQCRPAHRINPPDPACEKSLCEQESCLSISCVSGLLQILSPKVGIPGLAGATDQQHDTQYRLRASIALGRRLSEQFDTFRMDPRVG